LSESYISKGVGALRRAAPACGKIVANAAFVWKFYSDVNPGVSDSAAARGVYLPTQPIAFTGA
jgi:hypothetical protein